MFATFKIPDSDPPRYVDPVRVIRRLFEAVRGDPDDLIAEVNTTHSSVATDRFVDALRVAFDLPLDPETGPLEDEVLAVWDTFSEFLDTKKKVVKTSPTSVLPTDFVPSHPPPMFYSASGSTLKG